MGAISLETKQTIINEYLNTRLTYRDLSEKYQIDSASICRWVMSYCSKNKIPAEKQLNHHKVNMAEKVPETLGEYKEALRRAELKISLLNTLIDVADEELKIDIRKKSGAKQLKK